MSWKEKEKKETNKNRRERSRSEQDQDGKLSCEKKDRKFVVEFEVELILVVEFSP